MGRATPVGRIDLSLDVVVHEALVQERRAIFLVLPVAPFQRELNTSAPLRKPELGLSIAHGSKAESTLMGVQFFEWVRGREPRLVLGDRRR